MSGCATEALAPRPALAELGSVTVAAREPVDRFDPLVYCGGEGAFRCPPLTPKTDFVPPPPATPVAASANAFMRAAAADLAGATAGEGAPVPPPVLADILFDFNASVLRPEAEDVLRAQLDRLRGRHLELAGYTDAIGRARRNDALAQQRAEAVRAFLLAQGLPANHISLSGGGLCCYVSPNDSEGNRRRNRRVEIRVKPGPAGEGALPGTVVSLPPQPSVN